MIDETSSQDVDDENCTDLTCAVFKKPMDFRITLQEESIELSTSQRSSSQSLQNQINYCNSSSVNDSDSQKEKNVSISQNSSILSNIVHPPRTRRMRNILKEEKQCDANFSTTESPCSIVEEKKVGYLRKSCKQNEKLRDIEFSRAYDSFNDSLLSRRFKKHRLDKACETVDYTFSKAFDSSDKFNDSVLSKRFKKDNFDKACENVDYTFSKAFDSWDKTRASEARSSLLNDDSNLPANSLNTETYVIEETIGLSTNSLTYKESSSIRNDCGNESYSLLNTENVDLIGTSRNITENEVQSALLSKSFDSPLHSVNAENSEELAGSLATSLIGKDCVSIRNKHENEELVGSLATSLTGKDCVPKRNEHENENGLSMKIKNINDIEISRSTTINETRSLSSNDVPELPLHSVNEETFIEEIVGLSVTSLSCKDSVCVRNDSGNESYPLLNTENVDIIGTSRNITKNEMQSSLLSKSPDLPLHSANGEISKKPVGSLATSLTDKDCVSIRNEHENVCGSSIKIKNINDIDTNRNTMINETQSSSSNEVPELPLHSVNGETFIEEIVSLSVTSLSCKDSVCVRNDCGNESYSLLNTENIDIMGTSRNITQNEVQSLLCKSSDIPLYSVNAETSEELVGSLTISLSGKDCVSVRNERENENCTSIKIENINDIEISRNTSINKTQSPSLNEVPELPLLSMNMEAHKVNEISDTSLAPQCEKNYASLTNSMAEGPQTRSRTVLSGCSANSLIGKLFNEERSSTVQAVQSKSDFPLNSVNVETSEKLVDSSAATSLLGKDCVSIRNERENESCSSIKSKDINNIEIFRNTTINETQSPSLNEVPDLPLHSVNMEAHIVDEITNTSLASQNEKNFVPSTTSVVEGSQTRSQTLLSDCSADSLIGKLFKEEISSTVQSVPSKKTRKKRKYSGKLLDYDDDKKKNTLVNSLPKKPHFPKFDRYMGEHFYKYLILKMEPKYGLRTNREVVKVAEFIYTTVKEVICANTNYSDKVEEMKFLLARKQVIKTHLEFYFYCFNHLPPYFNAKAVPMLQPCGKPPLIEFNLDIICDPVIPSLDIAD